MPIQQTDYDKLITISCILDTHILESENFFDDKLLNLIDTYLGYKSTAVILYDSDCQYMNSFGRNLTEDLAYEYQNNYRQKDPFARYISINLKALTAKDIKVVKSSDIFPDYKNSEYYQFLNSLAGLSYAAVIPFDNFRVAIYKNEKEGDFTTEEVLLLNFLEKILWSKFNLHSKITKPSRRRTLDELKNRYFDSIETGVIVLDSQFTIMDCNSIGQKYVNTLAPRLQISDYFSNLIPLLNLSAGQDSQAERIVKLDDFIIKIGLYSNPQSTSLESDVIYFITIANARSASENPIQNDLLHNEVFRETYNLSSREMDIVIALSNGQKYQDIASTLFISVNTVRTHVKNIYRKLDIDNQRNLLYIYNQYRHGEKLKP